LVVNLLCHLVKHFSGAVGILSIFLLGLKVKLFFSKNVLLNDLIEVDEVRGLVVSVGGGLRRGILLHFAERGTQIFFNLLFSLS